MVLGMKVRFQRAVWESKNRFGNWKTFPGNFHPGTVVFRIDPLSLSEYLETPGYSKKKKREKFK